MRTLIEKVTVLQDGFRCIPEGAVLVEDDKIIQVLHAGETQQGRDADCRIDGRGLKLTPGLIDIHIHGAAGHDLIEGSAEAVRAVAENVIRDGCTSFMGSLTVISHAQMLHVLRGLAQAPASQQGAAMLGIHSEGPYLSAEYKALMDERYLRDPSVQELDEMIEAAEGRLQIMTVAPERCGMPEFIQQAVFRNLTVMIGHTAASSAQVHEAALSGAHGFTHLYNAMSQHLHRDPGTVTGAFLETGLAAELIADGFHVDPQIVRMTWKTMGPQRLVLITDAMLGKGMPDGDFQFSGLACRKQGQHVRVIETGRRAGSAIGLNDAVRMMQEMCGCTDSELVQMACVNPAVLARVGNQKGRILPGMDADLALFDEHWQCHGAMRKGQWMWQRRPLF